MARIEEKWRDKDDRGYNEGRDGIELVFRRGGERLSSGIFPRFLPSGGGREWVIYRPFRILDDSGNLRYEASSVEAEDRAICLAKKSRKTELDRRTKVFIARSRTTFVPDPFFTLFPRFSLVIERFSNDFSRCFISSSLPGIEFFFSTKSFENFSRYCSKIFFSFFFFSKSINRSYKVTFFFSRNDIIRCNSCSGKLKKIFLRQQILEKFQQEKAELLIPFLLPPLLFFNLISRGEWLSCLLPVNLKSIPRKFVDFRLILQMFGFPVTTYVLRGVMKRVVRYR